MKFYYIRKERKRDWRVYYGDPSRHSQSQPAVKMCDTVGDARVYARIANRSLDSREIISTSGED